VRHFLIEPAHIRSSQGQAKVFIVLEAGRMSQAAQNALLKTLEEPPAGTFIVLVVEQVDLLLPTILSRCQSVPFSGLPTCFVRQQLEERGLVPEVAHFLAEHSQGRLGLAFEYAEDQLFELKRELLSVWTRNENDAPTVLARQIDRMAGELAERYRQRCPDLSQADAARRCLQAVLSVLAGAYRDAVLVMSQARQRKTNEDQIELVELLAKRWSYRSPDVIRLIAKAQEQIEQNVNAPLALESLAVRAWELQVGAAAPSGAHG
jgi:DNA polymerase-3 subunit delta'